MKTKIYLIGWVSSTIVFLVLLLAIYNSKTSLDEKNDSIGAKLSPEEMVEVSQDSLVRATLPIIFADPSFSTGIAKMPKEFPAFTSPTSDSGISMSIGDFSDYFKKVFKETPADQIIITAVQTDDPKILRWHIKIHEREE